MRILRIGEPVIGKDGQRLGSVERLVVDEQAHQMTHVVVNGRLVGAGRVRALRDNQLAADLDRDDLLKQPEAHDELVRPPGSHWRAPSGYVLSDFLRIVSALVGQTAYVPPVHLDVDQSAVHEIKAGSPVWSGRQQVGKVSELLTTDDGRVTAVVLQRPGLLGTRHVLPIEHVTEVVGTNVHVDQTAQEIEALSEPSG